MMEPERAERLEKWAIAAANAADVVVETIACWRAAKAGRPGCVPPGRKVLDPAALEKMLVDDIENFQKIAARLK